MTSCGSSSMGFADRRERPPTRAPATIGRGKHRRARAVPSRRPKRPSPHGQVHVRGPTAARLQQPPHERGGTSGRGKRLRPRQPSSRRPASGRRPRGDAAPSSAWWRDSPTLGSTCRGTPASTVLRAPERQPSLPRAPRSFPPHPRSPSCRCRTQTPSPRAHAHPPNSPPRFSVLLRSLYGPIAAVTGCWSVICWRKNDVRGVLISRPLADRSAPTRARAESMLRHGRRR